MDNVRLSEFEPIGVLWGLTMTNRTTAETYLVSVDPDERVEETGAGWRLGDVLGEDVVNALDNLTAGALRGGLAASAFFDLVELWKFIHGSTASGKLLDYVMQNDNKRHWSKYQIDDIESKTVREITLICE